MRSFSPIDTLAAADPSYVQPAPGVYYVESSANERSATAMIGEIEEDVKAVNAVVQDVFGLGHEVDVEEEEYVELAEKQEKILRCGRRAAEEKVGAAVESEPAFKAPPFPSVHCCRHSFPHNISTASQPNPSRYFPAFTSLTQQQTLPLVPMTVEQFPHHHRTSLKPTELPPATAAHEHPLSPETTQLQQQQQNKNSRKNRIPTSILCKTPRAPSLLHVDIFSGNPAVTRDPKPPLHRTQSIASNPS